MRFSLVIFVILFLLNFCGAATANLKKYLYPYEISELDWQLLQWTSAWHDSRNPAPPFILERMEYNRKQRKIEVYLKGLIQDASQENLDQSIKEINSTLHPRFLDFDPAQDLFVHYELSSEDKSKTKNIEYSDGKFSSLDTKSSPTY